MIHFLNTYADTAQLIFFNVLNQSTKEEIWQYRTICKDFRKITDSILQNLWDSLKNENSFDLKKLTISIEEKHQNSTALIYFKSLNNEVCLKNEIDEFCITGEQFERLEKKIEIYKKFWQAIEGKISLNGKPSPNSKVGSIINFLNSSESSPVLEEIEELTLNAINIEILPKEIVKFAYLNQLHLINNFLIPNLEILNNLRELSLSNNCLKVIPNLSFLKQLIRLDLSNNKIAEISTLGSLPNLKYLNLSNNLITTIPDLDLSELKSLSLSNNRISSISKISQFTNLCALLLNNNKIEEVKPLTALTNLKKLELGYNNLKRVEGLSNLKALKTLFLNHNNIQEIEDLEDLKLSILAINNNQLLKIPSFNNKFFWVKISPNPFIFLSEYTCKKMSKEYFVKQYIKQLQHIPQSPLAKFYQSIQKQINRLDLEKNFAIISEIEKNRIRNIVNDLSENQIKDDQMIFQNLPLLYRAAHQSIIKKFEMLSPSKKENIMDKMKQLAGLPNRNLESEEGDVDDRLCNMLFLTEALEEKN